MIETSVTVLLLLAAGGVAEGDKEKKPVPKFTISKETTFVAGPLDKDGYVDYEAALNDRLAKGVTPATNANVLIWKALGPRPEGKGQPPGFFRRLGIEEPPEDGEYFSMTKYTSKRLDLPPDKKAKVSQEMVPASKRPWAAEDHSEVAEWLNANEKPLALIIEATKRPGYYNPLVTEHTDKGPGGLYTAPLHSLQRCRQINIALAARAMLRVNRGHFDDAWQDLLACHRLGRLVGRGGSAIEGLVALSIEAVTSTADQAFLDRASGKALDCLRDLQRLPGLPTVADYYDFGGRIMLLETLMQLHRRGLAYLDELGQSKEPTPFDPRLEKAFKDANWDPALSNVNRWFDRIIAAQRLKDRKARVKKLEALEDEVKALHRKVKMKMLPGFDLTGTDPDKSVTKTMSDILVGLVLPEFRKMPQARDRVEQQHRNLLIAFALAAYRDEHGSYPKALDALAPKYLKEVPGDLFSKGDLIYRPNEKGYLLFSVGGSDLTIRMPSPEPKRK